MKKPTDWMKKEYNDLVAKGFDWKPPVITGASSARCIIDGSEKIMLCANNYLNLSTHSKVRQAAIDAVKSHGAGSGRKEGGWVQNLKKCLGLSSCRWRWVGSPCLRESRLPEKGFLG